METTSHTATLRKPRFAPQRQLLTLVVDLDERGSFRAHVENINGKVVFSFDNEDEETGWPSEDGLWLVELGYMRHNRDTNGLLSYMQSIGLARPTATLTLQD